MSKTQINKYTNTNIGDGEIKEFMKYVLYLFTVRFASTNQTNENKESYRDIIIFASFQDIGHILVTSLKHLDTLLINFSLSFKKSFLII